MDTIAETVQLGEPGWTHLADKTPFPAMIRNVVPDNTLSVEDARRRNDFTETGWRESYQSTILALAPHAGAIEANTDESAWWFYRQLQTYGIDTDVYTAHGFGKASFARWHVSMNRLHVRSFPKLRALAGNQYDLVVAFHLHDVPDDESAPKVLIGGLSDAPLRQTVADRLAGELPSKYAFVTEHDAHSMMGTNTKNPVNWLSHDGTSGLQVEVTPRISQTKRKTVGRQVAEAIREQYNKVIATG
jgi:phage replication-related protein YjqB (UPF0714/DUF867 family)